MLRRLWLLTISCCATATLLFAQPPICGPGAQMEPFCAQACIICDIDGFTGVNGNPTSNWDVPPQFCAPTAHNIRWIGFLAGSVNLTLDIAVSNCTNSTPFPGQGLQFGVYEVIDCNLSNSVEVTNCEDRIFPGTSGILTNTVPLVIGQYYYLVIDGWRDDVCNYSVSVTNGNTQVPQVTMGGGIMGPTLTCPGQPATYTTNPVANAPNHYWYLDGTQLPGSGMSQTINYPGPGTYQVCVEASNTCSTAPQECLTVVVADIPETTIPAVICVGECYDYQGVQLCNPGNFSYTFTSAAGCDSTVTIAITQLPAIQASLDTTVCFAQTAVVAGMPYGPGNYTVTLPGNGTCDTTLSLLVTELPEVNEAISATICLGDSYTFGSNIYTSSGTYTETFVSAAGCDSTVTLTLTAQPPVITNLEDIICFGESYTIGTTTYTNSGTYTQVLMTSDGCDSTVNLDLTVLPELITTLTEEICDGDAFTVGSTSYTSSGTYTQILQSAQNCDSTVNLTLTVLPNVIETLNVQICEGQTYTLGTQVITGTGTYTEEFSAANSCDSTVTLHLEVLTEIFTTLNETICDGQTYLFNGQSINTSGTFSATYTSIAGCDSTVTLNLIVAPNPTTNLTATICPGQSYTVGNQTFTSTGVYTEILTSAAGCDSTVTLNLTVQQPITTSVAARICEGDVYTVAGVPYNTAGSYTIALTSAAGCDSTVALTLTIDPVYVENITAQICDGQFYNIGGQGFNATGSYSIALTTINGCDSLIDLDLTVVQTLQETVQATICPGDSYTFNGQTLTTAGTYTANLTSAIGCDSIATLELQVSTPIVTSLTEEVCEGDFVTIGSQTFSTTGSYSVTLTSAAGCDSTINLDLTVHQPQSSVVQQALCQGDVFIIDGTVLSQAGTYNFVLQTSHGCDSLVEVRLSIGQSYYQEFSGTICPGSTYIFAGDTYTSAGRYTTVLPTINGCDSVLVLDLFVEQTIQTNIAATICDGQFYTFNGIDYYSAGQYFTNFTTAGGCDSLVVLDLEVVTGLSTSLNVAICSGDTYTFDGNALSTSGTYSATYPSAGGCDSLVTLALIVNENVSTQLVEQLCHGESIQVGPQTFSSSGNYTISLLTAAGCDSVITLDLSVSGGDTTRLSESICSGSSILVGGQTFSSSGNYVVDLLTSGGCDSTVLLALDVASQVALTQNASLCDGESVQVRGSTYSSPGTFTINVPGTGSDCDTIITLNVAVNSTASTAFNETICTGDTYSFDGQTLSDAGTYTADLQNTHGCDSTVTLNLAVESTSLTSISQSICAGESFAFDGADLSASGVYTAAYTGAAGCDSTVELTLNVLPAATAIVVASICAGEAYQAGGQSFSDSGTYTLDLTASNGCDSTLTLELSVGGFVALTQNASLCDGESVQVRGSTYSSPGTFTINVPGTGSDCDTIITLNVAVNSTASTVFNETICSGDTYSFDGQTLSDAGTYTANLQTTRGCDSTVTLNLFVLPTSSSSETAAICAGDSYSFAGVDYTNAGIYTIGLTNADGCDSIITLNLIVNTHPAQVLNAQICTGDTYQAGGQSFSESGTYTLGLIATTGCDSTLQVNLAVVDSIVVDVAATICEGQSYSFNSQTLNVAGRYRQMGTSAAGCDSVTWLNLEVLQEIQTTQSASICTGDSYTFDGSTISTGGTYTATYPSAGGCDSNVVLTLTQLPAPITQVRRTICTGEQVIVAGQTYTMAGTYSNVLSSASGCDSTVTLVLEVVDEIRVALAASICSGQTYTFDGQALTAAGVYTSTNTSLAGCDSLTELTLEVDSVLRTSVQAEVCAGQDYSFGGNTYLTSGSYTDSLTSSGGCDSIVTLDLVVAAPLTGMLDTTICAGEVLRLLGQQFSAAGTYALNYTASNGCDSLVTLELAVITCGSLSMQGVATNVRCFGEPTGSVTLTIVDAQYPITISYNCPSPRGVGDTVISALPGGTLSLSNMAAGPCTFTLTDAGGGTASLNLTITQPADPLDGSIETSWYGSGAVSCYGATDGSASVAVSGGTAPYDYMWSNGSTTPAVSNLSAGEVAVAVLDENGCPWQDAMPLLSPLPFEVQLRLVPLACDAPELGGAIEIASLTGHLDPVDMSVNGGPFGAVANQTALPAGTYYCEFVDVNGCEARDTVVLLQPEEPKLDLGSDREIVAGDTIPLRVLSTLQLDSLLWMLNVPGYMSCDDCPRVLVAPEFTTDYTLIGYTPEGCWGESTIQLRVRREEEVFVPTAFSPGGDGVNDGFTVFTEDQAARILELRVFDRWGEAMFVGKDFEPNQPSLGWDGTFRGEPMNPAVFVYWTKVRLRNGEELLLKGDVSLLR